jgi:hypothetical protein
MCTVSWILDRDGYQLFFNRDEKRTRKEALAPRVAESDGVRYLAPVDGDFGGTWIATNELGLTVGLLNGANLTGSSGAGKDRAHSRGLLVPELISSPSVAELFERILDADFAAFQPFTLAGVAPGQPAALAEWDGHQKLVRFQPEACFMLTSSSFDGGRVREARQNEFRALLASRGQVTPQHLMEFHQSHSPTRSAYSTCMHRPDAHTVSFTRIQVSDREAEVFYSPAAPCGRAPGISLKLLRRGLTG